MRDIDRLLRESLTAEAKGYEPRDVAAAESEFMSKRGRRRWIRAGGAGMVAAAAAVAVALFALVQPDVVRDRESRLQPAGLQVVQRYPVAEEPLAIAGAASGIWVASREGGTVTRIDPSTGPREEISLPGASNIAVDDTYAWASGADGRILRIDTETVEVTGDVVGNPGATVIDMAVGGREHGAAWAVDTSGCLTDLGDAGANGACINPSEFQATDVATGPDEAWILDGDTGDLQQFHAGPGVNEDRGVVDGDASIATAPTGRYGDLLLSTDGNDALWVSGEDGQLMRLDLVTGDRSITQLDGDYADLAAGYNSIWALVGHEGSDRGELIAINVATGEPTGEPYSMAGKPSDVYAGDDGVWVTLRETNEVVRIVQGDANPAPVETSQPTPSPDEKRGKRAGSASIVFSKGGDIWAAHADGSLAQLTDTAEAETYPVFTKSIFDRRGQAILFQRDRGDGTHLVYMDLSTLEESRISEGAWATFYPDGTGAWVSRAGSEPEIVVAPLFSEPILTFPAAGTSDPYSIGPIAWDQMRQGLFYGVSEQNGPEIYAAHVFDAGGSPRDEIEPQLLDVDALAEGDVLVAPTMSFSDDVDVLRLLEPTPSPDDGSYAGIELGTVDTSGGDAVYQPLVDLSNLPFAMDVTPARMTLTNAGELTAHVRSDGTVNWSRGEAQSWLVGDGFRLFLVDAQGSIQELPFEAGAGASVSLDYLPRD